MSVLIAIGRWLLGGAGSLLGSALGLVKRYPWQTACLALALACWHLSAGKAEAEAGRAKALSAKTAAQSLLDDERLSRAADRQSWAEASALAEAQWAAKLAAQTAEWKRQSEKADENYAQLLVADRDRAGGNADRMRFSALCPAVGGGAGTADGTAPAGSAARADRPGADAVVVERADYDILVENTARLIAARDWALRVSE